ncbi:MAG: hypothetical protein HDS11_02555 [Bacteroides sp.]|nr:hypothetical protein [Bacteroides sp.]
MNNERAFHLRLAHGVSDLIAKNFNITPEQAFNLFKTSKVYKVLMESSDEFNQTMPDELFELWTNERLVGIPVTEEDIKSGTLKKLLSTN